MITRERFRELAGLTPEQEDTLDLLRSAVISLWEDTTKRLWNIRADHEEIHTPVGARPYIVFLNLWPVTTLTSVEVREFDEEDWTTLDSTKYKLVGRRRLERYDGATWPREVKVTFDGGITEAAEEIQQALVIQVKFQLSRMREENIAIKSQNFEGGSGVYETATLHPLFKMIAKSNTRKA